MEAASSEEGWSGLTHGLLFVALAVPLFCLGATSDWGLLATAIVVPPTCAWLAFRQSVAVRGPAARIAAYALWGMAAVVLLQLVPLPPSVLRVLSPHAAGLWSASDALVGRGGGAFHPISLDPPATSFAAATALIVAAFFETASRLATTAAGRARVRRAIVTVIMAFCLVALVHPLFGLTKVFGVYTPQQRMLEGALVISPLINPNHAAAVACIAPPLLIGQMLETKATAPRVLGLVGVSISGAVAILTMSRGGMAVLGLEIGVMAIYAVTRTRRLPGRAVDAIFVGAALVGAVVAALYLGREPIVVEASSLDVSKTVIPKTALRTVADFRWLGIGRGAFGSVFCSYDAGLGRTFGPFGGFPRFTHVESWPVQLAVDLGVPAALFLVAAFGYAVARCARPSLRRPAMLGALVALFGIALHDLFDFATDFAGVALLCAALLSLVTSLDGENRSTRAARRTSRRTLPIATPCIVAAGLVAAALTKHHYGHELDDEVNEDVLRARAGKLPEMQGELQAQMQRHPAEPTFPLLRGMQLVRSPEAAPFLLHAIKLGPSRPLSHFWLARWFVAMGRSPQGFAEYRETLRVGTGLEPLVADDMLAASASIDELEATFDSADAFDVVARQLQAKGRPDDAARIDEDVVARFPHAVPPRVRMIERARAKGDVALARTLADELVTIAPDDAAGYLQLAALETDPIAAEDVLEKALRRSPEDPALLEALVRRRGTRLGLEAVTAEIERLRTVRSKAGEVHRVHALQGEVELARHRPAAALPHYLDAAAAAPQGGAGYLEIAGNLAESLGNWPIALSTWRSLANAHPENPQYGAALERVEKAMTQH